MVRGLLQIDYDFHNWSWLLTRTGPRTPIVLRPPASDRDDVESAPAVKQGGIGSSGASPKGAEAPLQSISPKFKAGKRKRPVRDGSEERRGAFLEVRLCF